jgi:hypothetical protein
MATNQALDQAREAVAALRQVLVAVKATRQ